MNPRLEKIVRKLAHDRSANALSEDDYTFLSRLVASDAATAEAEAPRPLWSHLSRRALAFGEIFEVPSWDFGLSKIFTQAGMPVAQLSYEDNEGRWVLPVRAHDLQRACAWALQQDDGEVRRHAANLIGLCGFTELLPLLVDELESGRGERTSDAGGRISGALAALAMLNHPRAATLALVHAGSDDYRIRNAARQTCVLCCDQLTSEELHKVLTSNFEAHDFTKAPHLFVAAARQGGFDRDRMAQVIEQVYLSPHVTESLAELVVGAGWQDSFSDCIAHDDGDLRTAMAVRAAWSGLDWVSDPVLSRLEDEDNDETKMALIAAIGSFGGDHDAMLRTKLNDGSAWEKTGAIWAVFGRREFASEVRTQLGDSDSLVRAAAACVLATIEGDDEAAVELAWNALLNRDDWWPWAIALRALQSRVDRPVPKPVQGFGYVSEAPTTLAAVDEAIAFFRDHPAELVRWLGRDAGDVQRVRALHYAGAIGGESLRQAVEQSLVAAASVDEAVKAARELEAIGGAEHDFARVKLALALSLQPPLAADDLAACVSIAHQGTHDIHTRAVQALERFGRAAEPHVAELLFHPDNDINNAAGEAITRLHGAEHAVVRDVAALFDGSVRRVVELDTLARLFNCPARRVREALAEAAGRADNEAADVVPMLLRLAVDKEATVVTAATAALAAKLPDVAWIHQVLLRNSRSDDWQLVRGTVATMAQIGDPAFVPRLVELATADDQYHQDAAVRGLERVAERFSELGIVVLDIRDPYRLASHHGISEQIDHNADRHSESLRILMLALDKKRSADRAVKEQRRKVMLTPLGANSAPTKSDNGWTEAAFEQLALYLAVTFVDEETGTIIAEVTTEPTGEVLSALLQTRSVCAATVAWS